MGAVAQLFSSDQFMPHGMCIQWRSDLLLLHVISDGLIALAYFSIPFALVYFTLKRTDIEFRWMFWMFGGFIIACGTTHLFGIWTMWNPDYGLDGLVKAATAAISIVTAIVLWRIMPQALAIPSPVQLMEANSELRREMSERREAEAAVRRLNAELEERVRARTAELEQVNVQLAAEIGERRRAEAALKDSETRFRDFADAASDWLWETDRDLRFTYLSPRRFDDGGQSEAYLIGKTRQEIAVVEEDEPGWRAHLADLEARRPFRDFVFRTRNPHWPDHYVRISGKPVFGEDGVFLGYRGVSQDVTAEVTAERRAREAHERLVDAIDSLPAGFMLFDRNEKLVMVNRCRIDMLPAMAHALVPGASHADIVRATVATGVVAEAAGREEAWIAERIERARKGDGDTEMRWNDGRWFQVYERRTREAGIVIVRLEITERKRLEQELAQAQKMEAVGQLTGGVAHDFNNLLTVVLGNLDLLLDRLDDGQAGLKQFADQAIKAAERGAELSRRLLAFARRQPLQPRVVDANRLVSDMSGLLHRTLGETIEIETVLAGGLWTIRVDPAQLENALLNLAINARDAMPDGGRLTIETANARLDEAYTEGLADVAPGQYVMLAVTDTGTGMPLELLARVFEPFFTTKETGKGSGLGLSMVYGFVKQSSGHVRIYSEVGQGTSVKIYFPRTRAAVDVTTEAEAAQPVPTREGEAILVVEDDPAVRALAVMLLTDLGYRIREAATGPVALDILAQGMTVDLLFTDVVLPGGMSGRELAEAALRLRPGLKVLFTSGYTQNAIVHQGRLDEGVQLLSKPYKKVELARKIRAILDAKEA